MSLKKISADTLLTIGTFVVNLGVFAGGSTRALAYSGVLGTVKESPGPQILSDDGEFLWVYAALWAICACLAVYDMVRVRLGPAIIMLIPLLMWWTASYGFAWWYSHFRSWDWMSVGIYSAACLCIGGLLAYIFGLRKKIQQYQDSMTTGMMRHITRQEQHE